MRTSIAALLLLSPLVHAQGASEDLALVVGGALGGVSVALAAGTLAYEAGDEVAPVVLASEAGFALGVGVGVPVAGRLVGADGAAGRAVVGALVGGAAGVGVTGGLLWLARGEGGEVALEAVALGAAVSLIAPMGLALSGYQLAPTVSPFGGPGLALRVRM